MPHLLRLEEAVGGLVELLGRHVHRLLHLAGRRAHELGVAVLAEALVAQHLFGGKFSSHLIQPCSRLQTHSQNLGGITHSSD